MLCKKSQYLKDLMFKVSVQQWKKSAIVFMDSSKV